MAQSDTTEAKASTTTTPTAPSVDPVMDAAGTGGSEDPGTAGSGTRFGKAIEEAKAGVEALKGEAMERTAAMKDKVAGAAGDWTEQAGAFAGQARDKGVELARQGKTKASEAIAMLGRTLDDSATMIDEKLGVQYGEYARGAARTLQASAEKLDAKPVEEIGDDMAALVRKSPAVAVGIAAVAGFMLARMFRGSSDT